MINIETMNEKSLASYGSIQTNNSTSHLGYVQEISCSNPDDENCSLSNKWVRHKTPKDFEESPLVDDGCFDIEFTNQQMIVSCEHHYYGSGGNTRSLYPGEYGYGVVYDISTWEVVTELSDVKSLHFSPSSELLATTVYRDDYTNSLFRVYDTTNWSIIYNGTAGCSDLSHESLSWNHDGSELQIESDCGSKVSKIEVLYMQNLTENDVGPGNWTGGDWKNKNTEIYSPDNNSRIILNDTQMFNTNGEPWFTFTEVIVQNISSEEEYSFPIHYLEPYKKDYVWPDESLDVHKGNSFAESYGRDITLHSSGKLLATLTDKGITIFVEYEAGDEPQSDFSTINSLIIVLSFSLFLGTTFVFVHKPTFEIVLKGIKKIPSTGTLVEFLESSRQTFDEKKKNSSPSTDSIIEIILFPFILVAYAIYLGLIAAFYVLALYLMVAVFAMLAIGSVIGFVCFAIPLFFLSLLG